MHEPPEARDANVIYLGDYAQRLATLETEVGELRQLRAAVGRLFRRAAILGGAPAAPRALADALDVPPGNGVIDVLLDVGGHMERIQVDTDEWPRPDPDVIYAALLARPCGA
jgi:hypothetical protein